jgi:hypothetical protein
MNIRYCFKNRSHFFGKSSSIIALNGGLVFYASLLFNCFTNQNVWKRAKLLFRTYTSGNLQALKPRYLASFTKICDAIAIIKGKEDLLCVISVKTKSFFHNAYYAVSKNSDNCYNFTVSLSHKSCIKNISLAKSLSPAVVSKSGQNYFYSTYYDQTSSTVFLLDPVCLNGEVISLNQTIKEHYMRLYSDLIKMGPLKERVINNNNYFVFTDKDGFSFGIISTLYKAAANNSLHDIKNSILPDSETIDNFEKNGIYIEFKGLNCED